ncbi:hypothetical protein Salat_1457300 [Sesamum alatum]|uniref:Chromo domain-containing protein n=1 Tax=Sesamum alatum TaxID=300844 RepID=A0AAE1YB58_9LAMI|nr:hypothetical protein Salat_1457300 [Sesamum alatum]
MPEKILDHCSVPDDGTELLVQWKGLFELEVTWEDSASLTARFPDFRLLDKASLDGSDQLLILLMSRLCNKLTHPIHNFQFDRRYPNSESILSWYRTILPYTDSHSIPNSPSRSLVYQLLCRRQALPSIEGV